MGILLFPIWNFLHFKRAKFKGKLNFFFGLRGFPGYAELLPSEVRRKNDGRLPQGGQLRLETIAALAVRLRETVRRLSQEWETAQSASSRSK